MAQVTHNVSFTAGSSDYQVMLPIWTFLEALYRGNQEIENNLAKYLVQYQEETTDAFNKRKETAYFEPFLRRGVDRIVDLPFSKEIVPPEAFEKVYFYKKFVNNVDGFGTSLTNFTKEWFRWGFLQGLGGVLVDNPALEGQTRREDLETSPTFVFYKAKYIKGLWGYTNASGEFVITRLWLEAVSSDVEQSSVGEGNFKYTETSGSKVMELIRDESGESVQIIRRDWDCSKDTPQLEEETTLAIDEIPFVMLYTGEHNYGLKVYPEVYDLAKQNKAHFNQLSDHTNIVKVASYPEKYAFGFATQTEIDNLKKSGSRHIIYSKNRDCRIGYVEHSGKAIEVGANSLDKLEKRMESFAGNFLSRAVASTATQIASENQESVSHIQALISTLESRLLRAVNIALKYRDEEELEEKFNIFSQFSILNQANEKAKSLGTLYNQSAISLETYLEELKKIQHLSPELDVKKEVAAVRAERNLDGLGGDPGTELGLDDEEGEEEGNEEETSEEDNEDTEE